MSSIQIVNLADNINAAFDKINDNFSGIENGTIPVSGSGTIDSATLAAVLDSDYFITVVNQEYLEQFNINVDVSHLDSDIQANADALISLEARIDLTDSGVTVLSQAITQTEARLDSAILNGIDSDLLASAIASANSSVISRIDANSDSLTSFAGVIDSIENDLLLYNSDLGNFISVQSTATSSLTSEISVLDSAITAMSVDITTLTNIYEDSETGISAIATAVSTLQSTVDNLGNTEAIWGIDLVAGTTSDPKVAGIKFGNNGATADFAITTDTFKILPTDGTGSGIAPFSVVNGIVELSSAKVTGQLDVTSTTSSGSVSIDNDGMTITDANSAIRVILGKIPSGI